LSARAIGSPSGTCIFEYELGNDEFLTASASGSVALSAAISLVGGGGVADSASVTPGLPLEREFGTGGGAFVWSLLPDKASAAGVWSSGPGLWVRGAATSALGAATTGLEAVATDSSVSLSGGLQGSLEALARRNGPTIPPGPLDAAILSASSSALVGLGVSAEFRVSPLCEGLVPIVGVSSLSAALCAEATPEPYASLTVNLTPEASPVISHHLVISSSGIPVNAVFEANLMPGETYTLEATLGMENNLLAIVAASIAYQSKSCTWNSTFSVNLFLAE